MFQYTPVFLRYTPAKNKCKMYVFGTHNYIKKNTKCPNKRNIQMPKLFFYTHQKSAKWTVICLLCTCHWDCYCICSVTVGGCCDMAMIFSYFSQVPHTISILSYFHSTCQTGCTTILISHTWGKNS